MVIFSCCFLPVIAADILGRVLVAVYPYSGEEEIRLILAPSANSEGAERIYEQKE